jgi:hypothetical protein
MRQIAITVMVLLVAFAFAPNCLAAEPKQEEAKSENKLVGTWKLVSAKYDGKDFKFPEGTTMVKHVTPSQFMWATYDKNGKVSRAAGGSHTLNADKYEETPEYGIGEDFEVIKGKTHSFTWKIDGTKWYHNGELSNGLTIEEVWERVEKK